MHHVIHATILNLSCRGLNRPTCNNDDDNDDDDNSKNLAASNERRLRTTPHNENSKKSKVHDIIFWQHIIIAVNVLNVLRLHIKSEVSIFACSRYKTGLKF